MYEQRSFIDSTKQGLFDQLCDTLNRQFGESTSYSDYQDDPVGFGEQVLGEQFTDDVKRLMLSVRDNMITVAKSANATGKTHAAARIAIWYYKVHPDAQVYTAAAPPESNLKKLMWGEIGGLVEGNPSIFAADTATNLHVQRSAKSFLTGVTIPSSGTSTQREARFSGKHAPHLLFILDEGDAIPDEVYKGIESCMSGGHTRLLIMFNPRHEAGEVYRMERDRRANVVSLSAFDHPNVAEGADIIPGAVTRDTTVRRINEWCRPLAPSEPADKECFLLPKFLENCIAKSQSGNAYQPLRPGYYKIIEPAFSYMVLGEYPSQASNQLIARDWIARARSRWSIYVAKYGEQPPMGATGTLGLDVAEFGNDANICCFRYGGYVERMVAWKGVDTIVTGDRVVEEYRKKKNVGRVNVDATGVGAGVAPYIQRKGVTAFGVKVAASPTTRTEIGEFHILRDQLWWACREWLRTDTDAMLPPDEVLLEELQAATYEVFNGKIRVMKKDSMRELLKRSPDRADALCLTFYEPELLFPEFAS